MWRRFVCWLLDHHWVWAGTRGDHGEPCLYRCVCCGDEEERGIATNGGLLLCRCLGGCKGQYPVFVFDSKSERMNVEEA